jgi:hypothetical protein
VLDNQLINRLRDIPGIYPELTKSTGVTDSLNNIDVKYRTLALEAYNDALRVVFQVALCMACIALPGALAMEWRSVKENGTSKRFDRKPENRQGSICDVKEPAAEMSQEKQQAGGICASDVVQIDDAHLAANGEETRIVS